MHNTTARGEKFAERPHVFEIAAGAVDEHDRRLVRIARAEFDDMQPAAGDRHEAAGWWMRRGNPARADRRE